MNSLVDALSRDIPPDELTLFAPGNPPASYTRAEFVEMVWKTGNLFRQLGAHEGSVVAVAPDTSAAVPLAIVGGFLNGATVHVDPPNDVEATLLVAPGTQIHQYNLPPGAQCIAHTDSTNDPAIHSFAESVWSENPFFPHDRIFADTCALADTVYRFEHGEIVDRVVGVLESGAIEAGDEVVVRAPLSDIRTVIAGLVAPLYAGAAVRFLEEDPSEQHEGDVAIVLSRTSTPEPKHLSLDQV